MFSNTKSLISNSIVVHAELLPDGRRLITHTKNGFTTITISESGLKPQKLEQKSMSGTVYIASGEGVFSQKEEILYEQN